MTITLYLFLSLLQFYFNSFRRSKIFTHRKEYPVSKRDETVPFFFFLFLYPRSNKFSKETAKKKKKKLETIERIEEESISSNPEAVFRMRWIMHTTDEGSIVVRRTKTLNGSIFQLARRQLSRANDTQTSRYFQWWKRQLGSKWLICGNGNGSLRPLRKFWEPLRNRQERSGYLVKYVNGLKFNLKPNTSALFLWSSIIRYPSL